VIAYIANLFVIDDCVCD